MVAVKSILLLLALGTESLVASQSVICQSKLGTKSIPASKIPRATTTIHNKVTVQKKVIRKVNVVVVPRPTTTTPIEVKTITETTEADPDIETAIETKTDLTTTIEVRLHTTTSVSTSYTTTTRYTTTSTIRAPAGFTPAKGPDWRPKVKVRDSVKERAAPDVFPAGLQLSPEYVQRIDCTNKVPTTSVKVTTVTVKGTRVTAKPKTKIKLVTVESVIPVEHYEACSDANLLRSANGGNRISQISVKFTSRITSTSGLKNAYECCVICQQTANCLFSNWRANSVCAVYLPLTTDFCSNGQQVAASYYSSAVTTNDFVLSNGQCGKLTNGAP
ncbi:hypothetical protein FOC1_g10007670 [Fusarium oxysporum f. sp. cubense race 1]|uniref:Apple domain-containing protein n=1 Tax=Fusarium oxysporum f. sp. cubense (strain race 1) TaxID=1229664 RepID=N4U6D9_FUSC1|nr:hypothetical protein FOC1_g10007670 [Fusarium oxysporum f. sp. cubense race 1]